MSLVSSPRSNPLEKRRGSLDDGVLTFSLLGGRGGTSHRDYEGPASDAVGKPGKFSMVSDAQIC